MDRIVLEYKFSKLYDKSNYTLKVDKINNKIYEYDMKNAGMSIIKKHKLLPTSKIYELEGMDKHKQNVAIGTLQIKNKKLKKDLSYYFRFYRREFFKYNNIQDGDVLSVKKDAIFLIGRKAKYVDFKNIVFVLKNNYDYFYYLNNKIEIYYNIKEDKLDIKGINDTIVKEHEDGIVEFLKETLYNVSVGNEKELRKYLINFNKKYKSKKLPMIYYREFNQTNTYRFTFNEYMVICHPLMDTESGAYSRDIIEKIDSSFNYNFFIIPIIRDFLFI